MACPESLETLKKMDASLTHISDMIMLQWFAPSIRGRLDVWNTLQKGKVWIYDTTVTYQGVAVNTDLNIPYTFQLNRIEQIWNDATTKDFSIQIFTDPSSSAYIELDTQTGNTATSRVVQAGNEYKFPAGTRIRINSAVNTLGKTDTIKIQIDEV